MEADEFKRILEIGLGRAVLYLQNHDATPYRDVILDCCLHNTTYDPQVEGGRIDYLLDVIGMTKDEKFYRDKILAHLQDPLPIEDRDEWQLFDFAKHFARGGDEEARQTMYSRFVANVAANSEIGIGSIVDLDGINGFIFVVNQLGDLAFTDEDDVWHYDVVIWGLEDRYGKEETRLALEKAMVNSPHLQKMVSAADEHRASRATEKRPHPSSISYDEIKRWIADPKIRRNPPISWHYWGEYADDEAMQKAAEDLLAEEDEARLIAYLRLFKRRHFPLDHNRLIALVRSREDAVVHETNGGLTREAQIVSAALIALENVQDASVRALAFGLLKSLRWASWAADLLVNNLEDGDWKFIETWFARKLDKVLYHNLGLSVAKISEANPSRGSINVLKLLYETGPCSNCRRRFVEDLHSLGALPDWMREECKYDANPDLRELARNNFQPIKD